MSREEYSPYKIIHHPDKLRMLKNGLQTVPLQAHMVVSNSCNQRCSFCAYRMKDFLSNESFVEKDMLSSEKVYECLENFKTMGIKAVQYTGGGEPLVHPDHLDFFKKTLDLNLDLALVTNGMALRKDTCDVLGDASWTRVSVDSARPDTYGFIRNVKKLRFHQVLGNISNLVKYRRKSTIGVGFVVEKENYLEIFEAAKLFKELGVDNFRISGAFTPMGYNYFDSFKDKAIELSKKAEELSDSNFTVFNLFGDRLRDTFEGKQEYSYCPIKDLQVYVGADYNIYTCCTLAYNKRGLIGSIKDQSFMDVWTSQDKIDMYNRHDPKTMCGHPCIYRGKNNFINYCIKQDAKHVNFI